MNILETYDLKKIYGNSENCVRALDGINVSIKQGKFVAIVGASGCGKSTFLNMIGALDHPTSGNIFVQGRDIATLNKNELSVFRRRYIGFVFQNYNLLPVINGYDNITLPIFLDKGNMIDNNYITKLIKTLNIEKQMGKLPSEMSGGQQQRIAIARALANKPSLILADEPTGNLDSKASLEVICLLKQMSEEFNQTILMVTHNEELAQMCDYNIYMKDGKVIKDRGGAYENDV